MAEGLKKVLYFLGTLDDRDIDWLVRNGVREAIPAQTPIIREGHAIERLYFTLAGEFSVTSEVMPGVERSFTSFPAAAEEATLSRIFAGVHFLFDLTTGQRLGRDIADFSVDNFLTSRDRDA